MTKTIKLLLTGLILAGSPALINAQVPQKFNYQGVARDTKGNPLGKQTLGVKLSVLPTADATMPEYEEVQTITTNEFGLYTLQIGNGQAVTGTMSEVKWESGNKYIRVSIDPRGGTNYIDAGTTQLLSVPYAIYADRAGMAKETAGGTRAGTVSTSAAGTGTVNYLTKFTAANTIYNSQVFDNGTNVGIGTASPSAKLHISQNNASVLENIRMQNLSATGAGRFTLYSDGANNYSTFTKYGSAYAGGYAGISTLYPYGNLLAFGNNGVAAGDGLGRFLISSGGNVGISLFKSGTSKLKFHADFATENVGIGGNSAPVSRVHLNNTDGTSMDVRITNNTSGHTASDGLLFKETGNAASILNQEAAELTLGTNNAELMRLSADGKVGIGTTSPIAKLHVASPTSDTGLYVRTGSNAVNQIGILGTYNSTVGYGTSIVGKAYNGTNPPASRDIGVYGSSSDIGVWSQGALKVVDGYQGLNKVLVSIDSFGTARWEHRTVASDWAYNNGTAVADTTIDGTAYKRLIYDAPDITADDLNSSSIDVYLSWGSGSIPLPYTSGAGGGANTMNVFLAPGKIILARFTHATPATPTIGISSSLQIRYVITRH